ncbi:hypothetical protein JCM19239_591 [Vibrio variabilis]|uniref:Uncharacterized protein n=1 Tax=Vibrio variabilis TaxID=990271 RepID=A0ABQ0JA63_9VIBR|nr:hypothetical protein JCM19239_591 [Vibrio variabilis]
MRSLIRVTNGVVDDVRRIVGIDVAFIASTRMVNPVSFNKEDAYSTGIRQRTSWVSPRSH